jgi:hypothetical protein
MMTADELTSGCDSQNAAADRALDREFRASIANSITPATLELA